MNPEFAEAADRLIGDDPQIASLPTAYMELSKLVDSPSATAEDAARAVSADPALTAQILRLANSPLHGGVPIHTVTRAVAHLGLRSLRDLALASSVVHMFRFVPENVLNMERFWQHSLATALCAQQLGRHTPGASSEALFVAGLLHDIGGLLLCVQVPRVARRLLMQTQNESNAADAVERDVLGTDHAVIGQRLLERWNLPQEYCIAVGYHHHPSAAPAFRRSTALIHVADIIVEALEYGHSGEHVVPPFDPQIASHLGLQPRHLYRVIDDLDERFDGVLAALMPAARAA